METQANGMTFHDAANIFPMDDEHIDELAEDIRSQGQQVPIEVLDGQIIDGRRRFMACKIAGVKPAFRNVFVDDPVAYVLSLNRHRRHLSETQLAMVGARASALREKLEAEAKERKTRKPADSVKENLPSQKGQTRDQIGKAVGVSGKTIDFGTKVLKDGTPKLIAAVDADKIAVSTAAKIALMPPERQDEYIDKAKGKPTARHNRVVDQSEDDDQPERKGVGILRANEAINCLIRIPKNDALRKRGFQIVTDWIKANR